jgi:hypothetical protein
LNGAQNINGLLIKMLSLRTTHRILTESVSNPFFWDPLKSKEYLTGFLGNPQETYHPTKEVAGCLEDDWIM